MLLAYLDEIGAPGAFVSPSHPRFADSPAFGYGGFIIPEDKARVFGAYFAEAKKRLFKNEIPEGQDPGRWEKKGASLLYARVCEERPQNLRVFNSLIGSLRGMGGHLFYYVDEKPVGTPKQTNTGPAEFERREQSAMYEALNRIARHADKADQSVMVMMDQINEKSRKQRLPQMYAHILGRAADFEEMRRIIEPPMHIDSTLSANIQFADWVCALVKRAVESQLVPNSRYEWLAESKQISAARGAFTYESKLHLFERGIPDLVHSDILDPRRPVVNDPSMLTPENRRKLEQVRVAAVRAKNS